MHSFEPALFALAALVAASGCSSPELRTNEFDSGNRADATIATDADTEDMSIEAGVECRRVCANQQPCTFATPGVDLPFAPPDNLPEQEGPITFESMEGLPEDVTGLAASGDERWPGRFHYGSFVPEGESFRAYVGIQGRMRSTTNGPYRVQVAALVDYEFVEFTYRAPMPGREDNFSSGTVLQDVFEVPEFPVIVDFELSPDALGTKGLRDVVFLVRVSDQTRENSHRYAQRSTIFYGGNKPIASHPCHQLGPTFETTEQEDLLSRVTYFFYRDEMSYQEQVLEPTQEIVGADQRSIELTLAIPPSSGVRRYDAMPEVLFIFRNEELILKEFRARHSAEDVDPETMLSDRIPLTIDLPLDEDRFEIWGFAVQYPFEPEIQYETGGLNLYIQDQVDTPLGTLSTQKYRITRESTSQ